MLDQGLKLGYYTAIVVSFIALVVLLIGTA